MSEKERLLWSEYDGFTWKGVSCCPQDWEPSRINNYLSDRGIVIEERFLWNRISFFADISEEMFERMCKELGLYNWEKDNEVE